MKRAKKQSTFALVVCFLFDCRKSLLSVFRWLQSRMIPTKIQELWYSTFHSSNTFWPYSWSDFVLSMAITYGQITMKGILWSKRIAKLGSGFSFLFFIKWTWKIKFWSPKFYLSLSLSSSFSPHFYSEKAYIKGVLEWTKIHRQKMTLQSWWKKYLFTMSKINNSTTLSSSWTTYFKVSSSNGSISMGSVQKK